MGDKGSADSSGMAEAMASAEAADKAYALGEQQFQWSQQVWNQEQPLIDASEQAQINLATQQTASLTQSQDESQQEWQEYLNTYQPLEQQYTQQAESWDSPQAIAEARGQAMADVGEQGMAGVNTAAETLRSYGVNPSSPKYAGLYTSAQPMIGAAEAAAGTTAAQNLRLQQMGLESGAINTGRGLVNSTGQLTQAGTGAGSAASGSASGAAGTAQGNLAGTAVGAGATSELFNAGTGAMNAYVGAVNGYNTANAQFAQANASEMAGIGSAVGGIAGLAFLKSDERDKTDIKREGTDHAGIPLYSYRYKEDPKSYPKVVGPMAQDIAKIDPRRVGAIPGSPKGTLAIMFDDGGPVSDPPPSNVQSLRSRPERRDQLSNLMVDRANAAVPDSSIPSAGQMWERMQGTIRAPNTGALPPQPYQSRNIARTPVNMNTPAPRPMMPPQVVNRPPVGLVGQEQQLQAGREGMPTPNAPVAEWRGGPIRRYDEGGDITAGTDPQMTPTQGGGPTGIPSAPMPPAQQPPGPPMPTDATPGGGVPAYASPSNGQVTDDVPAMLTANEFVIPKDVATWKGHEYFAKQIDQARAAQQKFSQRDDIGGEPTQATPQQPTFVSRPSNMGTTRGAIPGIG